MLFAATQNKTFHAKLQRKLPLHLSSRQAYGILLL